MKLQKREVWMFSHESAFVSLKGHDETFFSRMAAVHAANQHGLHVDETGEVTSAFKFDFDEWPADSEEKL